MITDEELKSLLSTGGFAVDETHASSLIDELVHTTYLIHVEGETRYTLRTVQLPTTRNARAVKLVSIVDKLQPFFDDYVRPGSVNEMNIASSMSRALTIDITALDHYYKNLNQSNFQLTYELELRRRFQVNLVKTGKEIFHLLKTNVLPHVQNKSLAAELKGYEATA
jgi:hypothetical protein